MYRTEHCSLSTGMQTISHEHKTNLPQSNDIGSPELSQSHSIPSSSITHLAPLVFHCNSSNNKNSNNNANNSYESVSSTPSCCNSNTNTNTNKTKRSTRVRHEYQSPYRQLPQRKSQHRQTESSTTTTPQTSLHTSLPQTAPECYRNTETLSNFTTLTTSTPTPTTFINTNTTSFLSPAWSPLARQPSAPNTSMQFQETIHNKEINTINSSNNTSSSTISGSGTNASNLNVSSKMRNVNITRLRNRELPPLSQTISHSSRANKSLMLPNKFNESTHAHKDKTFTHLRTEPTSEHHFAFSKLSPAPAPPPPSSSSLSSCSSSSQSLFLSPETLSTLSPQLCHTLECNQSNVLLHKELQDQALRILNRPSKPIGLHNATIPKISENITEPLTNVAAKTAQGNSNANRAIIDNNADHSTVDVNRGNNRVDNMNFFRLSADELNSFGIEAARANQVNSNNKSPNGNVNLSENSNSCVNEFTMSNFIALSSLQEHYAKEHQLHSIFTAMARDLLAAEPRDPQQ